MLKILLAASMVSGFAAAPAHALDRTIAVSGACRRQVTPDRGAITLVAEFRDKNLKTATQASTAAYEKAKEAVKRLGLENLELKTSEYSVTADREWQKERTVFKGYIARMGLWVSTSSIQRLGEVIDIATREDLREVGALQTYLSQEKALKEHSDCLESAAENARAKAEKLANALGSKVGKAMVVSEQGSGEFQPVMVNAMMDKAESFSRSAPRIEPGQQNISLNVSVTFELK